MNTGNRILVVDDNDINRELMEDVLSSFGLEAMFAVSGEDAVEKCEKAAFNIIFMDITLPGIDGMEAMRRIRANSARNSEKQAIFIALTAWALTENAAEGQFEGMDDILPKPFSLDQIKNILERHLGHSLVNEAPIPAHSLPAGTALAPGPHNLDLDRVAAHLGINRDATIPVLRDFFEVALPQSMAELSSLLEEGNFVTAETVARRLRAGITNIGLPGCLDEASALVRAAEARAMPASLESMAKLRGALGEMERLLPQDP